LSSDFVSCTYQLLQKKVSLLELKNSELNHELKERELSCEQLAERARAAQVSISSSV
jgi:kinesin family protein 4/21/27